MIFTLHQTAELKIASSVSGSWGLLWFVNFLFFPHLFHVLFLPSQQCVGPAHVVCGCGLVTFQTEPPRVTEEMSPRSLQGSVLLVFWVCTQNNSRSCRCIESLFCVEFFGVLKCCCFCRQKLANWFQFTCGNSPFTYSTCSYCKIQLYLQAAYLGMSQCRYPFCTNNRTQQGFFIWKV